MQHGQFTPLVISFFKIRLFWLKLDVLKISVIFIFEHSLNVLDFVISYAAKPTSIVLLWWHFLLSDILAIRIHRDSYCMYLFIKVRMNVV